MKSKLLFCLLNCFVSCSLSAAVFTVSNTKDAGSGSLRQAIVDNNATPGLNHITFNLPGKGPFRIRPAKELPAITNPVVIDGFTQNPKPSIEINGNRYHVGNGIETGFGLRLLNGSDGSTIQGLVFNEWSNAGLLIRESSNHLIQRNFIGTDYKGLKSLGNKKAGIKILTGSANNQVINNVIAGNKLHGIQLAFSNNNTFQSNLIGVNANQKKLPNRGSGIKLVASSHNLIGGNTKEQGNVIAYNALYGVEVGLNNTDFDAANNAILSNSIYKNKSLGITLHQLTVHDTIGPNCLQSSPDITSVTSVGKLTTIEGTLSSLDDQVYAIQFFSTPSAVPGQGKTFLGQTIVTADTYGFTTFSFTTTDVGSWAYITATSTQVDEQETSQFSLPRKVRL